MEKIDKNVVAKDNALVAKASYRLSVSEQRIILTLISKISPDDADFKRYGFKISTLYQLLGFKKESLVVKQRALKKVLKALHKNIIEIVTSSRPGYVGRQILIISSWIVAPIFDWEKDEITLQITDVLKPYLLQLKEKFTCYSIAEVSAFKCAYSFRILEFCKHHEPRPDFYNLIIKDRYVNKIVYDLKDLRENLGLAKTLYARVTDLKKRVLIPAQREINNKSGSYFEFEMIRQGRRVTGVKMFIFGASVSKMKNSENPDPNPWPVLDEREKGLQKRLSDLGVMKSFQNIIFSSGYDREKIESALAAVEEWALAKERRGENLIYPGRVFELALLRGWESKQDADRRFEENKAAIRETDREAVEHLAEGLKKRAAETAKKSLEKHQAYLNKYETELDVMEKIYNKIDDKVDYIIALLPGEDCLILNKDQREKLKTGVQDKIDRGADFQTVKSFSVTELLLVLLPS